jgi:hypothetical protein
LISLENRHFGLGLWIKSRASTVVLSGARDVTRKRPTIRGSFGGHFDELVKHFPHDESKTQAKAREDRELIEKRDIHALLFERAWRMDGGKDEREG